MISYFLTFAEGILTFVSPCILPMLPIYFLYLAGESKFDGAASQSKNKLVLNSIGFVIGFTIVFIVLGATVTSVGHFLTSHRILLEKISGLLIILFGLYFIGILKISFLNKEKRFEYNFNKLNYFSSIVFGMVFGFGWTPCLGPFLGSALLLAGNSKTILHGITLLLIYSAGLGIPFILASVALEKVKVAFKIIQKYNRLISVISGALLVIAGIMVFTGSLKYISYL